MVLCETYGASECGLICNLPADLQRTKVGSCGTPFRHVHIQIRDEDGSRVLPARQTGEIWVKTPVVIKSYLNGPPLGLDVVDANGYYRTGDAGWLDEDGFLYISLHHPPPR